MFGYIVLNKPELKIKDYECYQSFYCGVCHALKEGFGGKGQLTLSYDMTFLAILLSGLYEPDTTKSAGRCLPHPTRKHPLLSNECIRYAADMNLLLTYYNLLDDWEDEKKLTSRTAAAMLSRDCRRLSALYPRQTAAVLQYLKELHACEKEQCPDLDRASGLTGRMLGEIFVKKDNDAWASSLRRLGFYLGKFIYLIDAYEDYAKDKETGNYNPFHYTDLSGTTLDEFAERILNMMMAEASITFELLPIIRYTDILRNIIYAGVWSRFDEIKNGTGKKNKEILQHV